MGQKLWKLALSLLFPILMLAALAYFHELPAPSDGDTQQDTTPAQER